MQPLSGLLDSKFDALKVNLCSRLVDGQTKEVSVKRDRALNLWTRSRDETHHLSLCHPTHSSIRNALRNPMSSYSQDIPSSFDPALLHSESQELLEDFPSAFYSDDIDALQQCITEDKAGKTSKGVVIQHRAWTLGEAFRSQGDFSIGTASVAARRDLD